MKKRRKLKMSSPRKMKKNIHINKYKRKILIQVFILFFYLISNLEAI